MTSRALTKLVCSLGLIISCASWAADAPTVHDVYLAAQSGRLTQAQGMIEQVIAEHPKSSKAHYVAAEIYAKEGKAALAKNELQTAEQLEPGLPYAKPQAVGSLKQAIGYSTGVSLPANAPSSSPSFPWGMLFLFLAAIAVITMIVRAISSRNAPQVISNYPGTGMSGQPYQAGPYAPMPQGGSGLGSGIVGGLATGAALGAGMVAGEALAHHFIDGNNSTSNPVPQSQDSWGASSNDMGGQDFGIADNSSWDDNSDIADISGGNDWT